MKLPDNNPKTRFGQTKPSMAWVPPFPLLQLGNVMTNGASKYGPFNYREERITASTYYNAAMRHLMSWWDGEDIDPESGHPHLAHVMACCAIVLDCDLLGTINDDRPETQTDVGHYIRHYAEKMKGDENAPQEPATAEPVDHPRDGDTQPTTAERKAWKATRRTYEQNGKIFKPVV